MDRLLQERAESRSQLYLILDKLMKLRINAEANECWTKSEEAIAYKIAGDMQSLWGKLENDNPS